MTKGRISPFQHFMAGRQGGMAAGVGTAAQARKKRAPRAPKPRPDPKPIDDIQGLPDAASVLSRVVVPFPPVELSPNWRAHWSPKARVAAAYRRTCWALALKAKMKVPDYARGGGKIIVHLVFFPPDRATRDDDNVPASFKAGRDGIADAMKCDDGRFKTLTVLHSEPRSCVLVTLLDGAAIEGKTS